MLTPLALLLALLLAAQSFFNSVISIPAPSLSLRYALHLYLIFYLLISFYLKGVSYSCLLLPSFSLLLFDLRHDSHIAGAVLSITKGAVTVIKGRLCSQIGSLFGLTCISSTCHCTSKNMFHYFEMISVGKCDLHISIYIVEV